MSAYQKFHIPLPKSVSIPRVMSRFLIPYPPPFIFKLPHVIGSFATSARKIFSPIWGTFSLISTKGKSIFYFQCHRVSNVKKVQCIRNACRKNFLSSERKETSLKWLWELSLINSGDFFLGSLKFYLTFLPPNLISNVLDLFLFWFSACPSPTDPFYSRVHTPSTQRKPWAASTRCLIQPYSPPTIIEITFITSCPQSILL